MISIIISSANNLLLKNVVSNIEKTIGVEFEIISFQNVNGKKGICEIYNMGSQQAKYDILCFMHEDICFNTQNWGKKVVKAFSDNEIGLLGLAGSTYKSKVPSSWFPPLAFGEGSWRLNIKQHSKYRKELEKHDYYNPGNEGLSKVACVDGVWLCTTKPIAVNYPFDEDLLKGFHGYDIDYSLMIGKFASVYVTFDILITHFSEGNFDKKWLKEMIKVHKKWNEILPVNFEGYSQEEVNSKESAALMLFLKDIVKNNDFKFAEVSDLILYYYKTKSINFFKLGYFYYKALRHLRSKVS